MRIIAKGTLERYGRKHAAALGPLRAWHDLVKKLQWASPDDIKVHFPSASFVGNRVVFNIKGNAYRLVVQVMYKRPSMKSGLVYVIKVMTHAEYDKVDIATLRHEG